MGVNFVYHTDRTYTVPIPLSRLANLMNNIPLPILDKSR